MAFQLIWSPAATTRLSYEIFRPASVVIDESLGSNDLTLSTMWDRWEGIKDDKGRRVLDLFVNPEATSVHPGW